MKVLLVVMVGLCLISVPRSFGQEAEFQQTILALQSGDLATAEKLAREVLAKTEPDNLPAARNLLGMVLGQSGRYDEAIVLFRENTLANPEDAGAHANWAQALRRAGRPEEAIPQLQKAAELMPDSLLYALQLRLARIESGEDEEIGQITMVKLQESPPPADWLLTAAAIALHREKWEEAKSLLGQARATIQPQLFGEILQDPAYSRYADRPELAGVFPKLETRPAPGPLTLEAVKAYKERNYNEALDRLQRAEEAGEAPGPISTVRGGVLMAESKFGEAAEAFKNALLLSPGDPSLYLNYGESLRANKQYPEASEVFQKGLQLDSGNELLGLKLAFTLVEAGQGAQVLETGLKDAKSGPLLIGKAAAAASQGQMTEAAEFLKSAKESLPPEAFTGILQDPVFSPYRDTPELSGFFQAPQ
jgi:tetratricopeptide (TPR) repeat protein